VVDWWVGLLAHWFVCWLGGVWWVGWFVSGLVCWVDDWLAGWWISLVVGVIV